MTTIDRGEFDQVKGKLEKVETDVEVIKTDVVTLKENERDAKGERKAIHGKLDEILESINQRIGAERIKATLHKWGWDSVKVAAGGVLGWIVKVLSGL